MEKTKPGDAAGLFDSVSPRVCGEGFHTSYPFFSEMPGMETGKLAAVP
jgi:hypothetical protein